MEEFLRSIIGIVLEGEEASTLKEPCPVTAWITTNPAWTGPGLNTDVRDEWPASNRLHYGSDISITIASLPHAFNLLLQSLDAV
jgi:hypothetical protein